MVFHRNLPMLHLTMWRLSCDSPVRPAFLPQWLHNFPSFEGSSDPWIIRLDGVPKECGMLKSIFDRPHFPFPNLLNSWPFCSSAKERPSLPSKDVGPRCRRSLSSPSGDLSSHFLIDLIRSFEISPTRIVFLYSDLFSSRDSLCWSLFSHSSNLIINIVPVLNKILLVPRGVFRPGSYPAIRPSRLCWGQDAFQAPTA